MIEVILFFLLINKLEYHAHLEKFRIQRSESLFCGQQILPCLKKHHYIAFSTRNAGNTLHISLPRSPFITLML